MKPIIINWCSLVNGMIVSMALSSSTMLSLSRNMQSNIVVIMVANCSPYIVTFPCHLFHIDTPNYVVQTRTRPWGTWIKEDVKPCEKTLNPFMGCLVEFPIFMKWCCLFKLVYSYTLATLLRLDIQKQTCWRSQVCILTKIWIYEKTQVLEINTPYQDFKSQYTSSNKNPYVHWLSCWRNKIK